MTMWRGDLDDIKELPFVDAPFWSYPNHISKYAHFRTGTIGTGIERYFVSTQIGPFDVDENFYTNGPLNPSRLIDMAIGRRLTILINVVCTQTHTMRHLLCKNFAK
jgi:hypothetical protein